MRWPLRLAFICLSIVERSYFSFASFAVKETYSVIESAIDLTLSAKYLSFRSTKSMVLSAFFESLSELLLLELELELELELPDDFFDGFELGVIVVLLFGRLPPVPPSKAVPSANAWPLRFPCVIFPFSNNSLVCSALKILKIFILIRYIKTVNL